MPLGISTEQRFAVSGAEVAALAAELIRIPTVGGRGEADAVGLLSGVLAREGIDHEIHEVVPGRPNLIAALGSGDGRTLWLNGHLDTVPIGNRLTWVHEPFGGDEHQGRLYGRGASDCKGGVASMVAAVVALRRAGVALAGQLRLTAVMGDEEGQIGLRSLLDSGMRADAFVSAQWSTAERIALGYRGLCWVEVRTIGRSAHGSRPASGINAVEQMLDIVLPALRALPLPSGRETPVSIPGSSVNLAQIDGGVAPNTVPDLCRATLDFRLVSGQRSDDVVEAVDAQLEILRQSHPQLNVERRILFQAEPLFTSPESELVARLGRQVEHVTGQPPSYFGKTGTGEVNLVHERLDIPVVCYGPGNDSGHGPDEFVVIEDLVRVAEVYALLAADFLGAHADTAS
jgi:succinyl-diaminopimelate desuccinylase